MTVTTGTSDSALIEPLTRREREVFALLAQGLTAPEIAEKLTIAVSSVKYHIQHVYGKLGVNGRRQAVARARELGLLQPASPPLPPSAPLAASPLARHNLPQQLTRLIGRESDIGAIKPLLLGGQRPTPRLVTLVGPGGAGKTRLALALAFAVLPHFEDGAWLVELAALADPELLAQTVATSLGVRVEITRPDASLEAGQALLAAITDYLRDKHFLLVLDNCEHLVEPAARLAEALLRACPRLQILATSREALGVTGEATWRVPGLALPPAELPEGRPFREAGEYSAVQLFAERAQAARPGFSLTPQNSPCLTQVCRQLDGLPLAIELAAARVGLLPVEQIASLLAAHAGFRLLTGGGRTALPRHQTLLATIDWSYQLLSEPERVLLRRLPVFAGGWTLAAAEAVCADHPNAEQPAAVALPPDSVLDALSRLAAKSLVASEPTANGEARFHLLETIREYALDKLEAGGEADLLRPKHIAYFLNLAQQAEPHLYGREQLAWCDRLDADYENLRRALDWALHSHASAGLRLAAALHYYWEVRGYTYEAHAWFRRLLANNPTPEPTPEWALSLARAAHSSVLACEPHGGEDLCQASLALSRALGPAGASSTAYALLTLAWIRFWLSPMATPTSPPEGPSHQETLRQESLALFELTGDDWGRARALQAIGFAAKVCGDAEQAIMAFEQCQVLYDQLGDFGGQARVLNDLGQLATALGDYHRATQLHTQALEQFRQLRDWDGCASNLLELSQALTCLGRFEEAQAAITESIALLRSVGHSHPLHLYFVCQADTAYASEDYALALTCQQESGHFASERGDTDWLAMLEMSRARIVRAQGNPAEAVTIIESILPVFRAGNHVFWQAYAQEVLGEAARDQGDNEGAAAYLETSLAWFRQRNEWQVVTGLLLKLGGVMRRQSDHRRAASLLGESLRRCLSSGHRPLMAGCFAEFAYLSIALAQAESGARLLGAHEALREAMGLAIPAPDQAERVEYDRASENLRRLLGDARFDVLRDEGAQMDVASAVDYALAVLQDQTP